MKLSGFRTRLRQHTRETPRIKVSVTQPPRVDLLGLSSITERVDRHPVPGNEMPRKPNDLHVETMRIPVGLIRKADRLRDWMETRDEYAHLGHLYRIHVIREALRRGLDSLDRERRRLERAERGDK